MPLQSQFNTPHLRIFEHQEATRHALLSIISTWVTEHIARPHPELGRPGAVCPFVARSLRQELTRYALAEPDLEQEAEVFDATFTLQREWQDMPAPGKKQAEKTIILVLPHVEPATLLAVHERAKPHYVAAGMMLGECYPGHPGPGIHNAAFHPMHSDVPLLIARSMVPTDLPFLIQANDPSRRIEYIDAFLRHQNPASEEVLQQAKAGRARAQAELNVGQS